MSSLPTALRKQLEKTIFQARKIADLGARKALQSLAVHEPAPYPYMDEGLQLLRRKLRAQGRQLGDVESRTRPGAFELKHLAEKLAYDQWHRILFARFLLENDLLIHPEHEVAVTLADCEELAPELGLRDAWAVAAQFAARELPEIFSADDPTGAVELSIEDRNPLIQHVINLPAETFTASDSLGWCYQFWQAERKDEVNASGSKIGADELPAVTQLFTEDYMVDFLLDNTLGAWHAGKILAANPMLAESAQSAEQLREAVALPGCSWKYLRFTRVADGTWTPAAGTFSGWPKTAKELTCLDPCMGSGHFMAAMFERLVPLRRTEEHLAESSAVTAVIRDNLFGLEIDPRCTQIAAFNLALAAWRRVGQCQLPALNLACSGLAPNARMEDWLKLAGDSEKLRNGMERLYLLFKDAPLLGSLINPRLGAADLYVADYHELQPLLKKALTQESKDEVVREMAVTAHGLAKAAELLAGKFTLVATNVPYVTLRKQVPVLNRFTTDRFPGFKQNLGTSFIARLNELCADSGVSAVVAPQDWLFLDVYEEMRRTSLSTTTWNYVVRLGTKAFQSPMWDMNILMFISSLSKPQNDSVFAAQDVSDFRLAYDKSKALSETQPLLIPQVHQLNNPDARIVFESSTVAPPLAQIATALMGVSTGDGIRFNRYFWEVHRLGSTWAFLQSTVSRTLLYGGQSQIIRWEGGLGEIYDLAQSVRHLNHSAQNWARGRPSWGQSGVVISQMGDLAATLYLGDIYDCNCCAIVPRDPADLSAVWSFCQSTEFSEEVRILNQALKVPPHTLLKIPFDLPRWQKVAAERYPHGLPAPFSPDPTQSLFNGHPRGSDQPLHVAVVRLLSYQWPRQTGSTITNCQAIGPDGLEPLSDEDGIVCLSSTKGEPPAAERLRSLLAHALGKFDLSALIANAGPKGSKSETLEDWLRDEFLDQHCSLFQQCPFIWHIWDGHKSGFSALVNYHKLTHANLEKLVYAYLGDWIRNQQSAVEAGEAGSDARLQAAKQLQARLKLILEGEPPYDIFVRWKPLSKQAIGWHPDINDGVRMNIRPFATADVLRKRVKIKWDKDRGKEPERDKKEFPWFWNWDEKTVDFPGVGKEPDGNRWNDLHYTNECKRRAREANSD